MPAPDRIKQLVETFEKNANEYRYNKNETELRRQFLDPFFEALGWDVDNKQGKDERHKEVAHEYSVEIDGQQKKADYAFRTEKDTFDFLVEAKKPSVKVESNRDAAFQIRRYGWSAKIPINILTDFEHFAIYDCRTRPNFEKDKPTTGRISILHYKEYVEKWDEIVALFSPEAIRAGALEQYKDELKGKKGTQEVDDAFLEEIEGWREALAKNIATRNKAKNLNEDQINFAVQMTIDRIIFLRIAEERGMEKDRRLFELADNTGIYKDLLKYFTQADDRYNSGLFHFKKDKDRENPDTLSGSLEIDDKVLKDIIKDLYYPSPYAFNYIPTEILGSVYERFLGKVIRLTAGGSAKVEEKPEVRKAGGVYYTPAYIVEYIVKNTVGKLLEGKTADEASKIKIVDPACGSGSFLLGAYQFLLDWHLDWYASNSPEKWVKNKVIVTADNKTYRLGIEEKKRILLNNIHGVDLDTQAVEVTKLSLLLKVVEDPGQLKMFDEGHILPNLNKNIKNGNALIGTDYFDGQMFGDMEEMKRVKPFDWKSEFPEVFKQGGFEAVIGNPPYVRQESLSGLKEYFQKNYQVFNSTADLYAYFIELALRLTKVSGKFSYIVSSKFVRSGYGEQLRKFIPANSKIEQFLDFGDLPVFEGATVYPCIFVLEKETDTQKQNNNEVIVCNIQTLSFGDLDEYIKNNSFAISQSTLKDGEWLLHPNNQKDLIGKILRLSKPLAEYCESEPLRGVLTGLNEVFIVSDEKIASITKNSDKEKNIFLPYLRGRNVHRYNYEHTGESLLFSDGITEANYPNVMFYMKQHKAALEARTDIQGTSKKWFELRPCKYYDLLKKPKIIYASVAQNGSFVLDEEGTFIDKTCYFIPSNDKYLLGLLNSKLLFYYFSHIAVQRRGGYFEYLTIYVSQLPIRAIDFNDPAEKSMHDQMVSLVEKMLALHKSMAAAKSTQESELFQRQITSTDRQIDELVYKLYGLTEDEVKIVEGM